MIKKHIVIATWFYEGQPGYLDFKYRIEVLANNYQVTLLLRNDFFIKEFADLPLNIEVISTTGTSLREQLLYIKRCADYCKSNFADLVVLLGSQLALMAYLLKSKSTLLYWNEHPTHFFYPDYRNPIKKIVYRTLLRLNYAAANQVSKVMPIGEAHHEDLLQHSVRKKQAQLIYMGVEDRFGLLAEVNQSKALRLVYTGTVLKERGRDVMLEGIALARAKGFAVELTIVGASDEQLQYCEQRSKALNIETAVKIVGRVPGDQIPNFLAQADLGICIWEDRIWWRFNPPTKLFEYLVAGLPVLGSRIRTHSDYVKDGQNGWIFDYDAQAFADVIAKAIEQRNALPAMSEAAHQSGQQYLWSAVEPQFLSLVHQTLESERA